MPLKSTTFLETPRKAEQERPKSGHIAALLRTNLSFLLSDDCKFLRAVQFKQSSGRPDRAKGDQASLFALRRHRATFKSLHLCDRQENL
jgi:hypothetical protein